MCCRDCCQLHGKTQGLHLGDQRKCSTQASLHATKGRDNIHVGFHHSAVNHKPEKTAQTASQTQPPWRGDHSSCTSALQTYEDQKASTWAHSSLLRLWDLHRFLKVKPTSGLPKSLLKPGSLCLQSWCSFTWIHSMAAGCMDITLR